MIKQSVKKRGIGIVLALFSAIAVAGDGLHLLPGLGHDCGETHQSHAAQGICRGSDCADAAHHQDCASLAVVSSGENCPICQFFTQAQSVPLAVVFEIDCRLAERPTSTIRPRLVEHCIGAYCSRAPPSCG